MGIADAIRRDVRVLHARWMDIAFPRSQDDRATVHGRTPPDSTPKRVAFRAWAIIGGLLLTVLYPLALVGALVKLATDRVGRTAARLGVLGVGGATLLGWGLFTAATTLRLSTDGVIAVGAASVTATVSAMLAVGARRIGGRKTTVFFAYPLAMTVFFLPPVVAAFYSPTLADIVFPKSYDLAVWLLEEVLWVGGVNEMLWTTFELEGLNYVWMWVALSFPVGWVVGTIVSLGSLITSGGE